MKPVPTRRATDRELDEALACTFPASDPVALRCDAIAPPPRTPAAPGRIAGADSSTPRLLPPAPVHPALAAPFNSV